MKRAPQSATDDVVALCKKYGGLLYKDEAPPLLQKEITEYETIIKEKMVHTLEEAHLYYENAPILFYNSRFLFNKTQLKLYFKEEQKELKSGECVCLILFEYSDTKEFVFTHVCPIDRLKWNLAPIILQHYKVFHLGRDIVQLSLDPNTEHCSVKIEDHPFEIKIEEEEEEQTEDIDCDDFETKEKRAFWLVECLQKEKESELFKEEEEQTSFNHYMQFLVDNRLIKCHFERGPTKKDYLEYYTKLISLETHKEMSSLFMFHNMNLFLEMRAKEQEMGGEDEEEEEQLLSLEDICKEQAFQLWLEAEYLLFVQTKAIHAFKQKIEEHVSFFCLNLPPQLIPAWLDYTVQKSDYIVKEEERGRPSFWILNREKNYKIRMEWLFKPEFSAFLARSYPQIERGCVFIDQNTFNTVFIPCLYRQTLLDTILWFYCFSKKNNNNPVIIEKFKSLSEKYGGITVEQQCRDLSLLDLDSSQNLIEYCETNGNGDSFVLDGFKELSKSKGRDVLRSSGSFAVTFEPFHRKNMPDLEDLFVSDILPPCLKNVLSPEHRGKMGNQDRLNAIRYLKTLDYADDEILGFLNTNDTTTYAHDLLAIMKTYNNKPRDEDRGPLGCVSIINLKHDTKNVFRCVYEEKKNGDKQVKYTTFQEKQPFINECCNKHFPSNGKSEYSLEMKHPLQFIRLKMNK